MAKKLYLGVDSLAKEAKKIYIGINNISKKVKKMYIGDSNGVAKEVYSGGSGVDPTKDSFTEAEFLGVIADGNQALMHIGATITLSNTYCETYEVIGVNHDGTTNTVDIMAHTQVGNQYYDNSTSVYSSASIRTWVNGTYFNEFSLNVRNAAKTMSVVTVGSSTVNDKVKLLSLTELGNTRSNYPAGEGSLYTGVFTPGTASADRWREAGPNGNSFGYWTRTRIQSNTNQPFFITSGGGTNIVTSPNRNYGVLPVLRF